MTFRNDQLLLVLNYDTNGTNCLSFDERCEIHRAISHKIAYERTLEFKSKLGIKIVNILGEISQTGYEFRNEQYYMEKETEIIKSKSI